MSNREWNCFCTEDGEPWAIFLNGHDHDLRTLQSLACKDEMRKAFIDFAGDADDYFRGNLNVGRWWIRNAYDTNDEDSSSEYPWRFCDKDAPGAIPITGARFE